MTRVMAQHEREQMAHTEGRQGSRWWQRWQGSIVLEGRNTQRGETVIRGSQCTSSITWKHIPSKKNLTENLSMRVESSAHWRQGSTEQGQHKL